MLSFDVLQTDGSARLGRLTTAHGQVATPVFMSVGTAGSVKGLTPDQLRATGAQMVLANAYHLMLRPGAETVARLGGLHTMMGWDGPILTDSGGYQIFSLAHLRNIDDDGVTFQSHIDGAAVRLTPARAVEIQGLLGADIIMQLDECPRGKASKDEVADAVRRSVEWAGKCKEAWETAAVKSPSALGASSTGEAENRQALFAIQQGGVFADLRAESAERIVQLDLPGYAIGGLSVGEGHEAMTNVLDGIDQQLPSGRPRYLMGVGEPRDILAAVVRGVDMFDCVLPTRNGRNGQAFTWAGRVRLRNARWAEDTRPLDETCDCYGCRNFSRGTLRHLFQAGEMLGPTLVTIHNLRFFHQFMLAIRQAIASGRLRRQGRQWLAAMYDKAEDD